MKFKIVITAFMLMLAIPAAAQFVTVEQAYEIALSDLRLPRSQSGTIAFKECEKCDYMTKRVGQTTHYRINGKSVSLERFRLALAKVRDRSSKPITVLHHLERNQVTEVLVNL